MKCYTAALLVGKLSAVVQRARTSPGDIAACPQQEKEMKGDTEGEDTYGQRNLEHHQLE